MTLSPDQAELAKVYELQPGHTKETPGFIILANDTLKNLKNGIAAINDLPTPAARTVAQYSLRGELGLSPDAYKQAVMDLLEEQETPAPTSFEELMKLDTGNEASIEDLAAKGSLTLWVLKAAEVKRPFSIEMAEAISTGENFAGRFKTTQGTALIYQVDESPTDAINKFRRMSLQPDSYRFLPRWKLSPSMIPEMEAEIRLFEPSLFADSLMRIFAGRGFPQRCRVWYLALSSSTPLPRYGTSFFLSSPQKARRTKTRADLKERSLWHRLLFNSTSDCWGLYPYKKRCTLR